MTISVDTTKKILPPLRFTKDDGSDYPDWQVKKLGEVLSIPKKVKPINIDKNKILTVRLHCRGLTQNTRTDTLSLGATNYYLRKKGQFIYGKQNLHNGAFGIIPSKFDNFLTSSDIPSLNINFNLLSGLFLLSYFSQEVFYQNLNLIATGTGSKRIHENKLLIVPLSLPCLEEQEKIAKFLASIDAKINLISLQLDTFYHYKKALLQQLFPHHTSLNPNLRFLKDNGSTFPTWEIKKLDEVATYITKSIMTKYIPTEKYISTDNMLPNKAGIKITNSIPKLAKCISFQKDDILLSNIRPYLKKLWLSSFEGGCSQDVLVIRKNNTIDTKYCYFILSNDKFFEYTSSTTKGTKMPRGDKKAIMDYKLHLPCLDEQLKIANLLSALDNKIYLNLQKLKAYQLYKKALLQQLFPYIHNTK